MAVQKEAIPSGGWTRRDLIEESRGGWGSPRYLALALDETDEQLPINAK
jgi:hypothetical protein